MTQDPDTSAKMLARVMVPVKRQGTYIFVPTVGADPWPSKTAVICRTLGWLIPTQPICPEPSVLRT